ncbi:hypothetical protein VTO42DRAFT_7302 [Malbranchea cinnamomea]
MDLNLSSDFNLILSRTLSFKHITRTRAQWHLSRSSFFTASSALPTCSDEGRTGSSWQELVSHAPRRRKILQLRPCRYKRALLRPRDTYIRPCRASLAFGFGL